MKTFFEIYIKIECNFMKNKINPVFLYFITKYHYLKISIIKMLLTQTNTFEHQTLNRF